MSKTDVRLRMTSRDRFMDWWQIECFLRLCEEGSITHAAKALGIVQPALSAQIAKLEKDLKVQLFERHRRGVTLTAAGADLRKMLLPLAAEIASVRQRMHDLAGEQSGALRIGVMPSIAANIMPRVVHTFAQMGSRGGIRVTEAYSTTLTELLESGALDFAVVTRTTRIHHLSTFDLATEELVLVQAASDDPIASITDLPPSSLILPTSAQGLRLVIDAGLRSLKIESAPMLEIDSLSMTLAMVEAGGWSTILPVTAIADSLSRGTVRIHRIHKRFCRELVVMHHPRRPLSLRAQSLCNVLETQVDSVNRLARDSLEASSRDERNR